MRWKREKSRRHHSLYKNGNRAIVESETGNPARFRNENVIRAFVDLDTLIRESGELHSTGLHTSKRGSKSLRTALYNNSLPAIGCNPVCAGTYKRLKGRGEHGMLARIGVAAKLLSQANAVMRKGKRSRFLMIFEYRNKQSDGMNERRLTFSMNP